MAEMKEKTQRRRMQQHAAARLRLNLVWFCKKSVSDIMIEHEVSDLCIVLLFAAELGG